MNHSDISIDYHDLNLLNSPRVRILSTDLVFEAYNYQEAVAVAVARGHLWCEMLESGRFPSLREMAARFGLCESYMARLIRMASLAPDIVEAIFAGNEPRGFSLDMLIRAVPEIWQEQRDEYGFANASNDH